jgi:hypothetical protein
MDQSGDQGERSLPARFSNALRELTKKVCLAYDTGPPQSVMLDVSFGREGTAPEAGGLSLFASCAWRLQTTSEVLCGCWDDKEDSGQMRAGLDRLVGQPVRRALAVPPGWDLAVEFENGLVLRVFCDQTNDQEGADNYSLYCGNTVYTVGTLSELYEEPRQ